jgi:hypothetical protein
MPPMPTMDPIPPEALLERHPPPMRAIAERLRNVVREAFPDAIERVRSGWGLIGYDLPVGRRTAYFAWVWPEGEHVHLGFQQGWAMRDPHRVLQGRGITKQVRWLTFVPGDRIDAAQCAALLREAAAVATMTRGERLLRAMDAEDDPTGNADETPRGTAR